MPFQKGNKLSNGRKGYEVEEKQRRRMLEILNKYLGICEKLFGNKELSLKQLGKIEQMIKVGNKILDKLHANKTDITSGGERIAPIIQISETFANKNDSDSISETNRN